MGSISLTNSLTFSQPPPFYLHQTCSIWSHFCSFFGMYNNYLELCFCSGFLFAHELCLSMDCVCPRNVCSGTLFVQKLCWSRNCFFRGTVFVQELCLFRNCVWPGTVFVQELCSSRNYVCPGTMLVQKLFLTKNCVCPGTVCLAGMRRAVPAMGQPYRSTSQRATSSSSLSSSSSSWSVSLSFLVNHKCHFPLTHVYTKHKSLCILNI